VDHKKAQERTNHLRHRGDERLEDFERIGWGRHREVMVGMGNVRAHATKVEFRRAGMGGMEKGWAPMGKAAHVG
jgi:hypothetical protein